MKNLRDKFEKLPVNKVENSLQVEDDDVEITIETKIDTEMEIEKERDGYDEQTEELMEKSEYDVEATEENLLECGRKLLKIIEEMLLVEINERKIKRVKQTPKKEILEKINTAAKRVWNTKKTK